MKPHLDEAWRALGPAERDIQALDVLKESKVHLSIIGFHARQTVEQVAQGGALYAPDRVQADA